MTDTIAAERETLKAIHRTPAVFNALVDYARRPCDDEAYAAIVAIRAALAVEPGEAMKTIGVPAAEHSGWRWVPGEPTVEMRRAAAPWIANYHLMRAGDKTNAITDAWQAMIKCAPTAPKDVETFRRKLLTS